VSGATHEYTSVPQHWCRRILALQRYPHTVRSVARSFSASSDLLISAPSLRVLLSSLRVSLPRSLPAKSMNENLPCTALSCVFSAICCMRRRSHSTSCTAQWEGMTAAQMATAVGAVQSEQFRRCFRWAAAVNSCPRRQAGRPGGSHASAMNLHSLQWTQQTAYAAPVAGGAISSTKPSRL
jgi:hypothetical protein